jgi:hypothetical protein
MAGFTWGYGPLARTIYTRISVKLVVCGVFLRKDIQNKNFEPQLQKVGRISP